jgi:hypothetical protein
MKQNLTYKLLVLAVAFGAMTAFVKTAGAQESPSDVGLFLEPGVSYELGKTTTDWPTPFTNSTGESNGLGLMGRMGLHVADIFFVGLDARYSLTAFKDSSVNYSADAQQFNWGPLIGVQTPLYGIRVWGNYVAGGFLDPKASGSPALDVKLEEPTGYRLGVGGRYMMLSINLEYQNLQYNKLSLESVGPFSANTSFSNVKPKNESWIVSVSFPFAI